MLIKLVLFLQFTPSPLFYKEVLLQQHHLLGLYKLSCLYLVEIDSYTTKETKNI